MLKLINLFVFLSVFCIVTIAAPYQELPEKPGYVPVYIREGNTPLSEVNPKLVEAFHENDESNQIETKHEEAKENGNDKTDELANSDKKDEEEMQETPKVTIDENVDKSGNEEEKPEIEDTVSDIAEFTSDDMKILAGEKTDN